LVELQRDVAVDQKRKSENVDDGNKRGAMGVEKEDEREEREKERKWDDAMRSIQDRGRERDLRASRCLATDMDHYMHEANNATINDQALRKRV